MLGVPEKGPGRQHDTADRRAMVVLAACFASCAFLLNYSLERRFDSLGVLDQYNVLFDSDPNARLVAMSHGDESGRNLAHPNFSNFLNLPIRVLGKIICLSGLTDLSELEVRRPIAMLVAPVASAVNVFLMCLLFRHLGFSFFQVALLAVLNIAAFTQVIFGSIPDHFALGGLCIVIMFFLVVDLVEHDGKVRWWAWLLVGVVTMGITITNLMIVGILLGLSLALTERQIIKPVLHTGAIFISIAVINFAIMFTMNTVFDFDVESRADSSVWVGKFLNKEGPLSRFARSPNALANAIAPPGLGMTDNAAAEMESSKYQFRFTLNGTPGIFSVRNLLGLAAIGLMLGGAVRCFLAGGVYRVLLACSGLVIAYNLAFHAIWGVEYFLYSQHWYFSGLLCLAGMMLCEGRLRFITHVVLSVFVVCVAVNNAVRIYEMLAVLKTAG